MSPLVFSYLGFGAEAKARVLTLIKDFKGGGT
jgi:hypothetical protein